MSRNSIICQRNENLEYQNMSRNLELSVFNKHLETLENNKIIVQKRSCKITKIQKLYIKYFYKMSRNFSESKNVLKLQRIKEMLRNYKDQRNVQKLCNMSRNCGIFTLKLLDGEESRFFGRLDPLVKVEQVLARLQVGFQNLYSNQFQEEIEGQRQFRYQTWIQTGFRKIQKERDSSDIKTWIQTGYRKRWKDRDSSDIKT